MYIVLHFSPFLIHLFFNVYYIIFNPFYLLSSFLNLFIVVVISSFDFVLRPKEKICVFPVTSPKKLG